MAYAKDTTVSPEQSQVEIQKILKRYGATAFMFAQDDEIAAVFIEFKLKDRRVRFALPLPQPVTRNKAGATMSQAQIKVAHEKAIRQRWRALVITIKAKLEIIELGITTLEEEFLPFIVVGDNQTVGDWLKPQLKELYEAGAVLPMLPMPGERRKE